MTIKSQILILLIVLGYCIIGFIVYGAINGDDEIDGYAVPVMLIWPVVLIGMIGIGLIWLAYNLGRSIGNLFRRK